MGRWRDPAPRDWMQPGRNDRTGQNQRSQTQGGTMEVERRTSRWSQGVRPLRRSEGVPSPLETPDFLHRAELYSVRARNRALALSLVGLVAVASILAVALRALLS